MSLQLRLCLAGAALLGLVGLGMAALGVIRPDSFTSNGALISGWYWLRATGHTATYAFAITPASHASEAWLNASLLTTNGLDGGCGYDATVALVLKNNLNRTLSGTLVLHNPFRPQYPGNTRGVGYQAYGAYKIPSTLFQGASRLEVTIKNPNPSTRHVAVNKDALLIAYK
jgi:hypothetical protein